MIEVNGRTYQVPRGRPHVAICIDGADPRYLDDAFAGGLMPALARWRREGTYTTARATVPTFTNPNNVSIVTGVPPAVHGISGNHFYDAARGADVAMNERAHLRAPTILEALSRAGARVWSVTAKDKLVRLIHPGSPGVAFSAESPGDLGRSLAAAPDGVYSAEASLFVLDAGVAAVERGLADVLYLSTTDYVQHKHAPGTPEARAFFAAVDVRLARLDALGATVGLTADHGMNDKTRPDGAPNVVFLTPILAELLGEGRARVTLPITDPYVVHHGALGGCAMVYLSEGTARARAGLSTVPGVALVLDRAEAAARFALPPDRIGDLMVLATRDAVLGKSPAEHDLSHVARGLRSHGGLDEASVPLALNVRRALTGEPANHDLFALLLNP